MSVCMMEDLETVGSAYLEASRRHARRIVVCAGTGCMANGAMKVLAALRDEAGAHGLDLETELRFEETRERDGLLTRSGCQGFCQMGPLVSVEPDGILYCKVRPADVPEIVRETLLGGKAVDRLLYRDPATGDACRGREQIPFYALQDRTVLKACGTLDPEDVREYVAHGGYQSAAKAFRQMTPEAVCKEILESGLRGRGGGGFPTGRKWELARIQAEPRKYIVCNGDEGDPGAFMDRSVMEGNPHAVLEGMMIAARAVGAQEGYVYVRAEYPLAVARVRRAVADAEALGLLGDDLFGTGLPFRVHVMEGAGAFVCGEETALLASIEGQRGMPMPKPPFPAQSGLFGKPTIINNVETLATVPLILARGAAAFKAVGTAGSPGTKTFALTGHVANTGLIEVPFGTTLRHIVHEVGGGVTAKDGSADPAGFKAVQIGGPSGGCLTKAHLDLPMDFDNLTRIGAMVGSGGLVVMNQDTCMVQVAKFFMQFTQNESCGKCVPCREGTRQMLALLEDIVEGRATEETLPLLETLARNVKLGALCGLGKTAPNPVLSTLEHFRDEYEAHVTRKVCPSRVCKALMTPAIEASLCKGCTLCARKCPVGAIAGERKAPHAIDPGKCIRCGACVDACKFNAITGA
ncbi:NADH dehydrogenase [Mesoterricola sediminis]|uniref:NADH dehydrogenase n=2 Tax=Mesoterricola sediminis TaxID=2927980 RepID=A0AA48GSM2_9BACT|nr:NADH-ubiquinone oxidoreductase-F iron-sulfur binding region domain-containing protein [Mesoterricola sediminis]BDU75434.1 NADH dehydrogenase [Mesoterricola sediminis]